VDELEAFLLYSAIVLFVAAAALVLTWITGTRHQAKARDEIFESGLVPTGGSRIRFPIRFFRIALFFLIFDLEVAFILLWAYVYRQSGWWGYFHISAFIGLLFLGLVYPWLKGGLDFVQKPRKVVAP